jgi:hypothetical protein
MVTRFLCSSCERLTPASSHRVVAGELVLVCARCGAESTLERIAPVRPELPERPPIAPPAVTSIPSPPAHPPPRVVSLRSVNDAVALAKDAAQAADPFEIPADRCPKCIGPRVDEALSCPHCGLVYVNFRPEDTAPSEELSQAMRAAMECWDDPSRHERILALARTRGELPAAGRFYRLRIVAAPQDPVALRGRDEVLKIASAGPALVRSAAPDEKRTSRWQYLLVAMLLMASVGLAIALIGQLGRMTGS